LSWQPDKKRMKDDQGRYKTQSLFLEYRYDIEHAIYTMEGEDKQYKGKTYPSLKRLYLEAEDVHEYLFATQWLYDWEHWKRLQANQWVRKQIDRWREEMEVMIASKGVQGVLDLVEDGNFQAAKFAADRQWSKKRGRPSKQETERDKRIGERLFDEFAEDSDRVSKAVN